MYGRKSHLASFGGRVSLMPTGTRWEITNSLDNVLLSRHYPCIFKVNREG